MPNTISIFFFFFQAEDGIRVVAVTGVQTCALPISSRRTVTPALRTAARVPRAPARPARGRVGRCASPHPAARESRYAPSLVGLRPEEHGEPARRERRQVPGDGLESCRGHALVTCFLGIPPEVGLPIERRRLAVRRGREPDQLDARDPDP